MANYICTANFILGAAFPASVGIKFTSALSEASAETAFHTGIVAAWNSASFLALMSTTTSLVSTETSTATGTWHQQTKTVTNATIAGGAAGASLPYHDAMVVEWVTAFADKSGHGRWYWPPLAVTAIASTGYNWSAAALTAAQTAFNAMLTAWRGNLTPVLLNRRALTTRNIINGNVSDMVAVQNRRADKRIPARTALTV
jgi:hypothetical protein